MLLISAQGPEHVGITFDVSSWRGIQDGAWLGNDNKNVIHGYHWKRFLLMCMYQDTREN